MRLITRRKLLVGSAATIGSSVLSNNLVAAALTASATEGPFYPTAEMRMADIDNDLVKVSSKVKEAGGEIIWLKGKLLSKDGKALAGLRIEIWQCDVNGKYLHPGDSRNVTYDSGFQGFGHSISDAHGQYSFRTIKPTIYPGRTPHIHVKVLDGKQELLTTQFYIAGDELNQSDSIFRRLSAEQARNVSMFFIENNSVVETTVDVIL